eukprot:TRINITY_DN4779_c0_g1_i2.p1 TRINITY_DN4779_c0_g1~~TRINITY_DN4779_c0_g1_i2.p1  ORF type:complete len:736 (+),score=227.12 TRINITY_DN4779_c0_g1_i2:69-2276(+)
MSQGAVEEDSGRSISIQENEMNKYISGMNTNQHSISLASSTTPTKKPRLNESQYQLNPINSPNGTFSHSMTSPKNTIRTPLNNITNLVNATKEQDPPLSPAAQLKLAEKLAQQLADMEKKKTDEMKQKRYTEDQLRKMNKDKVDDYRRSIEEEERRSHKSNKDLYSLYNDLQGIARDHNIPIEYPEIVVIGMQSDGKSSFVEGLLGFQFNIVESNIGTRRPLILQMINNPDRDQPRCRFRKENTSPTDLDPFEEHDTPVHRLVDEIVRRTNEKAGHSPDRVSDVPIILRVEYSNCANLTIYDTPGFRLGGDERLKNDIKEMVHKLIAPKNRIIVCLEQSTVEWANSTSRPMARSIDPDFSRTILVNTKFDNRVKELRNKESANKYMTGENLPSSSKPFFVSMPLRRDLESSRFRDEIRNAFLDDYSKLLDVQFDEERFLPQLGLFRVKVHLEQLLNEKFQQGLAPTLRTLEDLCKKTSSDLEQVTTELEQLDATILKNKAMSFVQAFVSVVDSLLAGSIAGDPDKNGETLYEEKLNSSVADWPDFDIDFEIQNAKLKVYGGAQYARLLNEFEYAAHSREFPKTSPSEVASAMGTTKMHAAPLLENAAANLVHMKAKAVFLPLIDIVLQRCSYLMKRLFGIAIEVIKNDTDRKTIGILSVYERFMNELRSTFHNYIDKTEDDCRTRLKDDFVMFTKMMDWDLISSAGDNLDDNNLLEVSPDATKASAALVNAMCAF